MLHHSDMVITMNETAVTQEVELVGHVSVDSGQVMIVDPCYVLDGAHDDPSADPSGRARYGLPCEVTLSDRRHGEFIATGSHGTGVASSSGYGDGCYPVYARKNDDGRVVELTIYFDEDPHTGEASWASQYIRSIQDYEKAKA